MDIYNVRGRIFDIQKFSVHDGPGIRTIVFLKGCALRCKWCCNPESQSAEIQTMNTPQGTKTIGRDVSVGEIIEDILKDMPYFRRSGGGITLSGGETLLQPEFAKALFMAAKENGITTAIESTGFAKYETIEKLLPYIDVYLMDIKHMNSQKHKLFTSQSNELILENAKKIAKNANRLIIRVPVIPTFNDTVSEITDIARFTKELGTVDELHLLPYHRLGEDKYTYLGRCYELKDLTTPSDEKMNDLKSAVESCGLKCQIGG
ncbi:MAG: glycyl-radical enzyme activating protein [Clostridia bacterium]|nr:glycyl-radical enzyme activating protein [Clostridia bacterium]